MESNFPPDPDLTACSLLPLSMIINLGPSSLPSSPTANFLGKKRDREDPFLIARISFRGAWRGLGIPCGCRCLFILEISCHHTNSIWNRKEAWIFLSNIFLLGLILNPSSFFVPSAVPPLPRLPRESSINQSFLLLPFLLPLIWWLWFKDISRAQGRNPSPSSFLIFQVSPLPPSLPGCD